MVFEWDGGLRDLYVLNTTIEDWQAAIDFLRSSAYPLSFWLNDKAVPLPENVGSVFANRSQIDVLLSIDISGMIINCHFFTEQELELDLDPREVNSEEQLNSLFRFMKALGQYLRKGVILTHENSPHLVLLRSSPNGDEIQIAED
jgi:hypothetical protein